MQNIIIQAQDMNLKTKYTDVQGRSIRNKYFRPIRGLGKNRLRKRSPEVYGKALDLLEKVDDLLRDLVTLQKSHTKDLSKYAHRLALVAFANSANKFLKEQKAINALVQELNKQYKDIAGSFGSINNAISESIGKSGKAPEAVIENENHDDYIQEQLSKLVANILNENLIKKAILGGRYWKHMTNSGKEFSKAFKRVFDRFNAILEKNIQVLKQLDNARSIGDPGEYQKLCNSGFINAADIINKASPDIKKAWENFDIVNVSQFQTATNPNKDQYQHPSSEDANKQSMQEGVGNFDNITTKNENPVQQTVPDFPPAITQTDEDLESQLSAPKQNQAVPQETKTMPIPMFDVIQNDAQQSILRGKYEQIKNRLTPEIASSYPADKSLAEKNKWYNDIESMLSIASHEEFLYYLTKKANNGASKEQIALDMLAYADKIDSYDPDYSIKLTAIAEGVLNG